MQIAPPRHPRLLLFTIFLLTAIEYLQTGMVAFAAGPIMGEIGAAPEEFSLISAVYACVAVMAIAKQRWLCERLGWRRFMLFSLAFFCVGAFVCASSTTYYQFLIGRIAMALGGGTLMTSARVLVNLFPPSPARFTGIKYFATALAIGSSSAPWLASMAVSNDGWQQIFWLLIAASAIAAALVVLCLPAEVSPRELRTQSHPVLLMTLVAGAFFTLYALQRSYYDFYGDVTMLLVAGMLGVLALAYFVHSMHRSTQPLLNLRGLRNTRYWSGVGLFTACYGLMAATNTMLPSLLQRGFGFPWEVIGRIQAVGLAATVLTWAVAAAILPKKPAATKFYVIGFFALFVFGWKVAHLNPDAELWTDFVPALGCYGVFVMLVLSTTAMQTFREVQHHETVFSHAQQVKNMLAQFGSSLGISLATVGLQIRTTSHYAVLNERFVTGSPDYVRSLQDLIGVFSNGGGQQATQMATVRLGQMLSQQATLMACLDYFLFLGCIGAMVSACMVLQKLFRYAHAAARTNSKG